MYISIYAYMYICICVYVMQYRDIQSYVEMCREMLGVHSFLLFLQFVALFGSPLELGL